jgi:hypothetical protein
MQNEPKLRPINACDFYPDQLKTEITDFNAAVEHIKTARVALTAESNELRNAALLGRIDKPEKLTADAAKLVARRVGLDVQEIGLIARKDQFQKPILDARKTERERLLALEQDRRKEIGEGLKAVNVEGARWDALINGDEKVRKLALERSTVTGFMKVVTEVDEQRLAFLQARISAAIPVL